MAHKHGSMLRHWDLLLAGLLLAVAITPAGCQVSTPWVTALGSAPSTGVANAVATDTAGNAFFTGSFRATGTFGETTLVSAGGRDVYVAKLSPQGDVLWALRAGGLRNDVGNGIAVDAAGNAYATGTMFLDVGGSADFGSVTLSGFGSNDVFVMKVDGTSGTVLWATRGGGSSFDYGYAIGVDPATGEIYVAGSFQASASFERAAGSTALPTSGSGAPSGSVYASTASANRQMGFLVRYSPNGWLSWSKSVARITSAATATSTGTSSTSTGTGTGTSQQTTTTSTTTTFTTEETDSTTTAAPTTTGPPRGGYRDVVTGVAAHQGTAVVSAYSNNDGYAAAFTSEVTASGTADATQVWMTDLGDQQMQGVTLDAAGNAYVAGYFRGTQLFGSTSLVSYGSNVRPRYHSPARPPSTAACRPPAP